MLDIKTLEEKQCKLEECLIELSKKKIESDNDIESCKKDLRNIYIEGFRHFYSKFFPLVKDIDKEGGVLDCLLENINKIKVAIEKSKEKEKENNENKDFPLKIFKLADHLNLEISRYCFICMREDSAKVKIKDLGDKINDIKKSTDKLSGMQMDIVAIIGIFSGIVFAFSGYMQSFAEAFKSINQAPPSKLTFFILLTGLVLFDIIYSMFYIIGKLLNRTVEISLRRFLWFNIVVMITDAAILNYSELKAFIFEIIMSARK